MKIAERFSTGHDDLIQDIKYNFYGDRMITCSSDQKIKVWDLVNNQWVLNDSWKAHDSVVLRVSWAHPEFGQLICSCSFDRKIKVWEEVETGILFITRTQK
jgi:nucleoporin SEH1